MSRGADWNSSTREDGILQLLERDFTWLLLLHPNGSSLRFSLRRTTQIYILYFTLVQNKI
jgi:hypothetical protein